MSNEIPEKMDLHSMDISEENRLCLKQLFPAVFTETYDDKDEMVESVDFEKLKAEIGKFSDVFESRRERYGMDWPGKKDALKLIQQPSIATLKPCRDESVNFDSTENLFIEGDNLEVLKLLQKSYYGKIKMIYIDPPYNTGEQFIYPDKYSETLETYLAYAGLIDNEGKKFATNTPNEGRFHTKWLNMMYPRLYLARNLLREDGVFFASIDDNEFSNLRKICDEIFGEENFIGTVIWNSTKSVTNTALISVSHTYNLIYAKDIAYFIKNRNHFRLPEDGVGFSNPDNDPRGPWKADPFQVGGWRPNQQYEVVNPNTGAIYKPNPGCSWKNDHKKYLELLEDNRIVFGVSGEAGPQRKRFQAEAEERGRVAKTWWDDVDTTTNATQSLRKYFDNKNTFPNPKPVDLIKKMIQLGDHTREGIILDFFAGSATTAEAVIELNREDEGSRKFLLIQLPEYIDLENNDQVEAVEFCKSNNLKPSIAEIGKERIRRVIKKIEEEQKAKQSDMFKDTGKKLDLGFKALKLDKSNFKIWEGLSSDASEEEIALQLEMHIDHISTTATQEDILYELLLKAGFMPTEKIERLELEGKKVFSIAGGALLICLENEITQELVDSISKIKPKQFICLDKAFQGNDQLKTNAVQTFAALNQGKDKNEQIVFRTV
jgi:adenine-specific DNA-methyltransferase